MKFRQILLVLAALLISTASLSASTIAHTWVSRSGSDSNPCTSTSPCLTFTGALSNTAAGGIITAEDAGDFGPVSISQDVTIDGNNLGSIIFSGGYGIYIQNGAKVTLQNLSINGLELGEFGIEVENGEIVTIDNCKITNITIDGILFQGAGKLTVENSRINTFIGNGVYGIEIAADGPENVVVRNTVIDASPVANGGFGFIVDNTAGPVKASLQNVNISDAGGTALVAYSGLTQITGSVITQSGIGVIASNGATISVASSQIIANSTGVCSGTSSKIRLDNNDIYDNTTAIGNCGGIIKTSTTNKTSGTITIPAADVSDSVTF